MDYSSATNDTTFVTTDTTTGLGSDPIVTQTQVEVDQTTQSVQPDPSLQETPLSASFGAPPSYPASPFPQMQDQPSTFISRQDQPSMVSSDIQQQPMPTQQQQQQVFAVSAMAHQQPSPGYTTAQQPMQGQFHTSPVHMKQQYYTQTTPQTAMPQVQYQPTMPAAATMVQYPVFQQPIIGLPPTTISPTPLSNLHTASACVTCPHCKNTGFTRIQLVAGNTTHAWAVVFFCLLLAPCIPYLTASGKDTEHYCMRCGQLLTVHHNSGRTEVKLLG